MYHTCPPGKKYKTCDDDFLDFVRINTYSADEIENWTCVLKITTVVSVQSPMENVGMLPTARVKNDTTKNMKKE